MPLNQEQGKKLKGELWLVLDHNEPPLTVDERNSMNHYITEVVDKYITADGGGTPPPSGGGGEAPAHVKLSWPDNKTFALTKKTVFEFTVPADEVPRYGAFQVTPTPDSGSAPKYTSILSESADGPPMEGKETSLESTTPRTSFTVTKPQPGNYVYAILQPGKTYYQQVTPVTTGAWQTNIQLLVMGKL
jgi:hypothetical protein